MSKYPIIVFEGVEGSGKSYHVKNIQKYFQKKKIKFIKLREPGGTPNSEKIRKIILNNNSNFHKLTDLLLYMASRNENIQNIIKKNYKKKVILIDRFKDSTLAYQHYGMNINKKIINILNSIVLKNIKPNFTFLNVVSMKNLKQRIDRRKKNRYDRFNYRFYDKVQKGFIKIARNKKNYMIVDSNDNILDNKIKILKKINSLLSI
tara:strand:- start:1203 stop:1817 length:615 start_codon:yes stop_codon:yes gene_type:complete